jgi:pyruvate/2-oxoglutarate dehydrogenase complex dihydrolipoamide acyltransferase (E2) component
MAAALYVPRVNNNDDEVKLVDVAVAVGTKVEKGQVVAQVETDKAVVEVEAGASGYVLAINGKVDDTVTVGAVLMWLGATADEAVPAGDTPKASKNAASGAPTAKAKALLEQHGIDASLVPSSGDRLSVADVEQYIAQKSGAPSAPAKPATQDRLPEVAGELKALKSEEKGMLATVVWHRDVAVPGYIEMTYDVTPWEAYAEAFRQQNGLLMSPLLPLMAWRLVELCTETAKLNATIIDGKRYEYSSVNLGFTVQAGDVLYLTVLRDSVAQGQLGFANALVELQRRAAGHRLGHQETSGATVGFSSMARWKVSRHIPILSPQTAVMVAHTVAPEGTGVLGATYDHRVINGSDVASMLRKLSKPKSAD